MGGSLVLNILRVALSATIAVLLIVLVAQYDARESRLQRLEQAERDTHGRLDRLVESIETLANRPPVVIAQGGAGDGTSEVSTATPAADPRTLPYWPTEDNILVDLKGEPAPPPDAPRGGTFQYYLNFNPRNLNVHVNNDAELQERITAPVYEYLATQSLVDPDRYIPGLANRVTVNEDYTVFTVYLRKGMYWHPPRLSPEEANGTLRWLAEMPPQEVTAADVKFTFDVVMDPRSEASSESSYLTELGEIEIVDDYTLRFHWKTARYYNLGSTLNLVFIYPEHIFAYDQDGSSLPPEQIAPTFPQHWFNMKMCGTGPFMFDAYEPNQYLRLRRNPRWWNPDKPVLDEIYLRIVPEQITQVAHFKKGEVDLLYARPPTYRSEILEGGPGTVKEMIEQDRAVLKEWLAFAYYYIGWNQRLPQFRERKVRQALAHLYPAEQIIRDVHYGLATRCYGPVHPWVSHYDPDLPKFPYDPERAKALLDEAGWLPGPGGVRQKVVDGKTVELRFKLLYRTNSPTNRDEVLLYQKAAAEAGVVVEPEVAEWTVLTKRLDDKEYEAVTLGWAVTWDSDPSQIWHSREALTPRGSNHVSYMNPELDAVIEGINHEFDPAERKRLWRRFQQIIVEDQPYCFTTIPTRTWFINTRTGNHYFSRIRPQDWLLPWFIKETRK